MFHTIGRWGNQDDESTPGDATGGLTDPILIPVTGIDLNGSLAMLQPFAFNAGLTLLGLGLIIQGSGWMKKRKP